MAAGGEGRRRQAQLSFNPPDHALNRLTQTPLSQALPGSRWKRSCQYSDTLNFGNGMGGGKTLMFANCCIDCARSLGIVAIRSLLVISAITPWKCDTCTAMRALTFTARQRPLNSLTMLISALGGDEDMLGGLELLQREPGAYSRVVRAQHAGVFALVQHDAAASRRRARSLPLPCPRRHQRARHAARAGNPHGMQPDVGALARNSRRSRGS